MRDAAARTLLLVVFLVPAAPAVTAATLYGVDVKSADETRLVTIDPDTGAVGDVGRAWSQRLNALAVDPHGTLFSYKPGNNGGLVRIDKKTGAGERVGESNSSIERVFGLVFGDGVWLAAAGLQGLDDTYLQEIDPDTGKASNQGALGRTLRGLAFTPAGALYGADAERGKLVSVDAETGKTTVFMDLPNVTGLTAASSRFLFAIDNTDNRLLRVDLSEKSFAEVGELGSAGLRGLALDPAPIPLPGALALLMGALGALGWLGVRGKNQGRGNRGDEGIRV
jgi:streptogramin lyase